MRTTTTWGASTTLPNPSPAPAACPSTASTSGTGATVYAWNSTTNEPFGELTNTYTPMGYEVTIGYQPGSQGGADYGLPTSVVGETFTQTGDNANPTHADQQNFFYDGRGNISAYGMGNGTWNLTYDSLNRTIVRQDPDGRSSYVCYYPDDSTRFTETTYQHYKDGSAANASNCNPTGTAYYVGYTYDADGNVSTEQHRHGGQFQSASSTPTDGTPGASEKYYDGLDRLVEVVQAYDSTADIYTKPWITRYLYDLTQNGTRGSGLAYSGTSIGLAYGNLYKTQEYLPSGGATINAAFCTPNPCSVTNNTFVDIRGQRFDGLDRMAGKYTTVQGTLNTDTR